MQKWEYQTVWFKWFQPGPDSFDTGLAFIYQDSPKEMNKLGHDGWECYQIREDVNHSQIGTHLLVGCWFKRPIEG